MQNRVYVRCIAILVQGASEASEADSQSCSIEISDIIYIYTMVAAVTPMD